MVRPLGSQSKSTNKQTKAVREICIQSGHQTTPNLNDRITGIRLSLSNGKSKNKLDGKYGWKESSRCPLFSKGKRDVSLFQLKFILNEPQAPIFVAVAGFAQFSPNYIKEVLPYKEKIKSNEIIIVSADTEPIQMKALKKGLSSQNIGQKPYEMGRKSAEILYKYLKLNEKPKKEYYYLDFHYCDQGNSDRCLSN